MSEGFGDFEKCGAHFAFEWVAGVRAANFEARAWEIRLQRVELMLDAAGIGGAGGAKVDDGAGAIGDYVGARAAFDDVHVDGGAALRIIPFCNARNLVSEFVDGVDAFFGGQAGVRGAAVHDNFGFADAFARGFYQAAGAEGGLQDEDGVAAAGFGFDELPGGIAADFFVGDPEEDDSFFWKGP